MPKQIMTKEQYFTKLPQANIQRSKFFMPYRHKTSFNAGKLIPIGIYEILPGDTFDMRINAMVKLLTPLFPTMDKAYIEAQAFFTPMRLTWEHAKEFFGENTTTKWEQTTEYEIPQLNTGANGVDENGLFQHMGITPKIPNFSINALPFRAYQLIWNEWYRDQNLIDPILINKSDATQTITTDMDTHLKVAKYRDYFTSALPSPQKGPTVMIPSQGSVDLRTDPEGSALSWQPSTDGITDGIRPMNLVADLTNALQASINSLRLAFATQRLYEVLARGGSRYTEIIANVFGVTSPDARQQRPEYLGGFKQMVSIEGVPQTQGSTGTGTPQGWLTGASTTTAHSNKITYSATEHGYIIILGHVRTEQTYSQGIERLWSRKRKLEFYFPQFAHLGEQAIYNHEIYAQGTPQDFDVFGYKEAWAEYRTKPNQISGTLRPTHSQPLDFIHYGIEFANLPILNKEFIEEPTEIIDRTIAQQAPLNDQFIADFLIETMATRPMPIYSVPGLIDHH